MASQARIVRSSIFAILAAAAFTATAAAQEANPTFSFPKGTLPPGTTVASDDAEPTFSFDFKGGTITDYIADLRKAAGSIPINVSVAEEMRDDLVPPISLRNVTPFIAVQVLQQYPSGTSPGVNISTVSDTNGSTLYNVRPNPNVGGTKAVRAQADSNSKSRLVLSLAPVLGLAHEGTDEERLNTILSAVEATLRLGRPESEPMPDLALHRESNLLIMLGTTEDRETVRSVLEQMAENRSNPGAAASKDTIELLASQAPDVVRAIREVIPEFNADPRLRNSIKIESPTRITISAPYELAKKMAGVIAYIDQPPKTDPEIIHLRAKIDALQASSTEQLVASRKRESDAEAMVQSLQEQVSKMNREVESAHIRRAAAEDKVQSLQEELTAAKARIQEFIIEYKAVQKALEEAKAANPKP